MVAQTQLCFINTFPNQEDITHRRTARKHSARVTHARQRQARIEQYQLEKQQRPQICTPPTGQLVRPISEHEKKLLEHFFHVTIPHQAHHCVCTGCASKSQVQPDIPSAGLVPATYRGEAGKEIRCRVAIFTDWAKLALTQRDALEGVLLAAHRQVVLANRRLQTLSAGLEMPGLGYIPHKNRPLLDCAALERKASCIETLRRGLAGESDESPDSSKREDREAVILAILFLAADEVWHGGRDAAVVHMTAATQLMGQDERGVARIQSGSRNPDRFHEELMDILGHEIRALPTGGVFSHFNHH
ncbi:uncharacterized protein B0I36DRAFT_315930 [Microdochium trichocladiopsis]|uniref:Uncharacterized protein n=1 Tax=Microdochium trichocladiopsis TaxID=1682393 RepID=A0A9P8YCL0_9PEZI|nr:uncharacterized protein B0I36DRAFT_315930 [Microdochium trichocladiopsis]KAH7038281.1 hypothetical protein B0I36DRAFT_315930 [Microdochium trichocladiopsis]